VAASGSVMWLRLCEAIGRPELIDDVRFRRADDRAANRAALADELNAALQARTSAEWVDVLNAAGVPCGPIYKMDEVFADPQVKHLQASAEVNHPRLGALRILNQPVKLSRTPAALVSATPERGEHTEEILREIGVSDADIELLRCGKVIL
jgi:formyl-CoA transferase